MKFVILLITLTCNVFAEENNEEIPKEVDRDKVENNGQEAFPGRNNTWPKGQVPYVIDYTLKSHTNEILNGIKKYHTNSCVRFIPRTNEKDYIRILSGKWCSSYVGRVGNEQPLSLGKGCLDESTIVHELGLALGLYPEKNKDDSTNNQNPDADSERNDINSDIQRVNKIYGC